MPHPTWMSNSIIVDPSVCVCVCVCVCASKYCVSAVLQGWFKCITNSSHFLVSKVIMFVIIVTYFRTAHVHTATGCRHTIIYSFKPFNLAMNSLFAIIRTSQLKIVLRYGLCFPRRNYSPSTSLSQNHNQKLHS